MLSFAHPDRSCYILSARLLPGGSPLGGTIQSIRDVAEKHLCTGCGICAYLAPDEIRMVDDLDRGRRPVVEERAGSNTGSSDAGRGASLAACPGWELGHEEPHPAGAIEGLTPEWGPVLELWEGHASDEALRFAGSSGGAASALALYGVERGGTPRRAPTSPPATTCPG